MRRALVVGLLLFPGVARADLGDFPSSEAARPLLATPGLTEIETQAAWVHAPDVYGADARIAAAPAGVITSAIGAEIAGRYGLFKSFEISFREPWTFALNTRAHEGATSGSGRARLGLSWTPPWTASGVDVAIDGALVLPTTAHVFRTDATGAVHPDHLSVGGSLRAKYLLSDDDAAHVEGGFLFPFANSDDRAADRVPPASFFVSAGSIFQLGERAWVDAAAGVTRTNRERIATGIVPQSDQFLVDAHPAIGLSPTRWYDLILTASLPVAGKNTSQAYSVGAVVRARF
ncbi:MAG TPA: hypothetical protein VMV18_01690 [bacterium]|nr:hypothetical protein [bacterium]